MPDRVREILLAGIDAARYGGPPDPVVNAAIVSGDRSLTIAQLKFDSLAWMEFCIAVELQSGQELNPDAIERMRYVFEIEDWLRART